MSKHSIPVLILTFSCLVAVSIIFQLVEVNIIISVSIILSITIFFLAILYHFYRKFLNNYSKPIDWLCDSIDNTKITSLDLTEMNPHMSPIIKRISKSIDSMLKRFNNTIVKIDDKIQIGRALAIERNHYRLFHTILFYSKKLTGADAGSIFIVENNDDTGKKHLRFKYSHTYSKNLPYEEFTMPIDMNSIAGYAAVTGETLNISDVYSMDSDLPYSFNKSFDTTNVYRTKSMLVIPMRDHLDNVIGIIQLINCKEKAEDSTGNEAYDVTLITDDDFEYLVHPFSGEAEKLTLSVAGEAGVALENIQMVGQIKNQFEAFVKASVTAIESRDIATSGHSFRVAEICNRIAYEVSEQRSGVFSDEVFNENEFKQLEFAALVHDFGKIYIDPGIFLKGKKLFSYDFAYLKLRLQLIQTTLEKMLLEEKTKSPGMMSEVVSEELIAKSESISIIEAMVSQLNDPTIKNDDVSGTVDTIIDMVDVLRCIDKNGNKIDVLTKQEEKNLRIEKGSLNTDERKIIESHVEYSYTFLKKIPWPEEYAKIPEIVQRHHEMLDGSGYPFGKKGKENIIIEARIMSVADIFDALIAKDRPYKKSIPLPIVLKILKEEADAGKLDNDIVDLFINKKLYKPLL